MKLFSMEGYNRFATRYIESHFDSIVSAIVGWRVGINEQSAKDLVMDMYISMDKRERNGEGYSPDQGKHVDNISVKQFVLGTARLYAKNEKYRNSSVEISASSSNDDDIESLSGAQKAYMLATAENYDEFSEIDESLMDMRDEVDYVINFTNKFSVLALIENWSRIANGKVSEIVLKPVKKLIMENEEFAESFKRVVEFSLKDRESFNRIVRSL